MKIMKTLTIGGNTYEIYDEQARSDIETLKKTGTGGVTSWNDLTDKPFGEESVIIEWDGNTEGRDAFEFDTETIYYKVSDVVPSREELVGHTIEWTVNGSIHSMEQSMIEFLEQHTGCFIFNYCIVVQDTEITINDKAYTAPSTGVYFLKMAENDYGCSLDYEVTDLRYLDEKFIPNTIARKSDISEVGSGGVTSWNDLEDKPFYEENNIVTVVESQSIARTDSTDTYSLYQIGQSVDISAGETYTVSIDGVETTLVAVDYGDYVTLGASTPAFAEANFMFDGEYGELYLPAYSAEIVTFAIYKGSIIVHPLEEKYIPDNIVRARDVPDIIRWDGNIEGKHIIDRSGGTNDFGDEIYMLVHVSNETPTKDQLAGAVMRVTERATGETTTTTINNTGRFISTLNNSVYQISNGYNHVVCYVSLIDNNEWFDGHPFNKGIYFVSTSNEFMSLLDYHSEDVNKISMAYLPEIKGRENQVIEWDNDATGLHYETVGDIRMYLTNVLTPEYADVIGAKVTVFDESTGEETITTVLEENIEQFDGGYSAGEFIVISGAGAVYSEITWDMAGLYMARYSSTKYVKSIEFNPAVTRTVIEEINRLSIQLDESLDEATKPRSWNDLTDKPFVQESVNGTIEWDGTTAEKDNVAVGSYIYYKICDLPSDDIVITSVTLSIGVTLGVGDSSFTVTEGDGATNYANAVIVVKKTNFTLNDTAYTAPSVGIYFMYFSYKGNTIYGTSALYEYESIILEEKCVPNTVARSASFHGLTVADAAGETVTAAEFNALLAALREAGYLAT